tara:strand:- start:62 stop:181 length:120 start_codon:yes stop_codon:yes gene_type:complete
LKEQAAAGELMEIQLQGVLQLAAEVLALQQTQAQEVREQ